MSTVGLVVVGAGPAGRSAVEGYRSEGGTGRVVLVGDEDLLPYERPPLSKDFLRGDSGIEGLESEGPDWYAERDVEVRRRTRAVALDREARTLALSDGTTVTYERCVLATGSSAVPPGIPGAREALESGDRVHVLRSAGQATELRRVAAGARSAVVVGSGFIGCEAAVSLARRGLDVTVLTPEQVPQQARLGDDAGRRIAGWLEDEGITVLLGTEVLRLAPGGIPETEAGPVPADVVLLATGHQPRTELAEVAGLALQDGRVPTDAGMRTADPHVFAAGDLALAENAGSGRRLIVQHWGEALAMGEIAGRNAAGASQEWAQAPGFWSEIGDRVLKQVAWGDGFDDVRFDADADGAFTAWYGKDGVLVGVLTHEHDDDYDRGRELVESGASFSVVAPG